MRLRLLLAALALTVAAPALAADWQPAKGPLLTRWAKDVKPDNVHPEYPRPQLVRPHWQNLNGLWQLAFARADEAPPAGKDLPEKILVPFPVESALSGVMKRTDRLWYRRTFTVPAAWAGKRTLLHFGAVDWEATVYVNGKKLGSHRGGYDAFSFDVTKALKPQGAQELVVGVWDPTSSGTQPRGKQVNNPRGIYYTPTTGIWQTVWLEPVVDNHLERLVIVPDVDKGTVRVKAVTKGAWPRYATRVTVQGQSVTAQAGQAVEIPVKDPQLWTPDRPHLYDLRVSLLEMAGQDGKVVDTVDSYFGMRKSSLGKDARGVTRMMLNNQFVFQVGPLDQGFWPDGLYTAPTDAALKYDIEVTKRLGFNMARKHVKVEPARWYYWCDKLGLLVWQDMPSGDRSIRPDQPDIVRTPESARQFETELRRMIDGLHNHPCIVMWVPFNEGWGQYDTARITNLVKEYDPTRLVDNTSGWADRAVGDVHDIHVYPGPGSPKPGENRAAVLGEFGGLGLALKGHLWDEKTWSYRGTADSADLTRKYERLLQGVYRYKDDPGLSAAVYTQTTDVETEANGLLTYDRAVIKVDVGRVAAANRGDFSRVPEVKAVVPTSQATGLAWHYAVEKPADDWYKPEYNPTTWKEGPGGFGTQGTPGAVVRTEWKTKDIWLRRTFTLPEGNWGDLHLTIHHDEDAEVYVNGVLAAKVTGFVTDYAEYPIGKEARAALKPGKNVFAVHCKQTGGGQYIDVGLVEIKDKAR